MNDFGMGGGGKKNSAAQNFFNHTFIAKGYNFVH